MKKIFVVLLLTTTLAAQAQKKPIKKTTAVKGQQSATGLKNLKDSACYAIGLSVANFYKEQGHKDLNAAVIAKAISDVQNGNRALLTEDEANEAIMFFINPDPTIKTNIQEGKNFLAANKKKSGIRSTASGIQFEILKETQGRKPIAIDTVVVNYAGYLLNGTEFDNSAKAGKPIEFQLNRVIKGWTEGLQLMSVGSKYKFYIPHNLAYGLNGNGPIPAGSTLVFEVELLDIKQTTR